MTISRIRTPERCVICGCYLTTMAEYADNRCLDPGHWQAAGLASSDFYSLARLLATEKTDTSTSDLISGVNI